MRDLNVITAELSKAATSVNNKKMELDKANQAASDASKAYDDSQIKASELRRELDSVLDLLVPGSSHGRIRASV